ncbi:MAG TPA: hypothetical protein VGJ60_06860 [Chloroflexota bacterium]|jgi:hypothetical protein
MSLDLDLVCDCCQQSITLDGPTYCDGCWQDTIATLPRVETALRELATKLEGDAAKRVLALAEHVYDWNITPEGTRGPSSS